MMMRSNIANFLTAVSIFSHSPPAVFFGYCCGGFYDASVVWRLIISCVPSSFLVDPVAILNFTGSLLRTPVGAHPTNFGESRESNG